jgi:hypothetical protein
MRPGVISLKLQGASLSGFHGPPEQKEVVSAPARGVECTSLTVRRYLAAKV